MDRMGNTLRSRKKDRRKVNKKRKKSLATQSFKSTCKYYQSRLNKFRRESLNQARLINEKKGNYLTAEVSLAQIQRVRQQAEGGLKVSLLDKHDREEVQIEEQNRLEFEEFTRVWDERL